ncbi:hypothetical protein TNCV_3336461 [Trichonephila clavipes]|nr:hypothetical protein TNCV_3336461 [Trichonephila clavipes]
MDIAILNLDQGRKTTHELAPSLPKYYILSTEDIECNLHLEISTEKKCRPTKAFRYGIINLRKTVACIKGKAAAGQTSRKQQWRDCQVIYSQFGLAIHQNDHQARRRFVEWAQNEIAVVPDFHKRILFSDEAHFWLNGYVNKQNCRIWSEANPQVYVETPLHPEKLTVWCALWAGGILLQKR